MALINNNPKTNFIRLLKKIQPTAGELAKAGSFSFSCKKRLTKSFDLKKFQKIGSHSRGAAIKLYSDLDFLVILARNNAKWAGKIVNSNTFISKISQDLNDRYVKTGVRKDAQAVVVNFGRGQNSMDVVPGFFKGFKGKYPIYSIPNGGGGWIETSPEAHNGYIKNANTSSRSKLVKVAQLIRYWKHCWANPVPLSSFYVDLLLANSGICDGVKSYPYIMYEFFKLMHERECRGLRDPLGISGVIYAVQTNNQSKVLVSAIDKSLGHAQAAILAEIDKKNIEANRQWDMAFNHGFI